MMEASCLVSGLDRISDLPPNVLVNILACLPLKDAVRTSALSKKWNGKWQALPHIMVKEELFNREQKQELESIITYILAQHKGKIEKCSIFVNKVGSCYILRSWILKLSEKCIQELTLETSHGTPIELPSNLFSCKQLRKLRLRHFEFKPPRSFKGFHNLVSLNLNKIGIETGIFESLIASCPVLEELTVKNLSCVDHLHINVNRLKYFCFNGVFKSIHFDTPSLAVLSVNLYRLGSANNNFDLRYNICGLPHSLEELHVECEFNKILFAGSRLIDSTPYEHLKILRLDDFSFLRVDEVSSLIYLMESFPELQVLDVKACKSDKKVKLETLLKFWEGSKSFHGSFDKLHYVKVRAIHGEDVELRFIQFILNRSPYLKEMTIEHRYKFEMLLMAQLMSFPRASKEAELKPISGDSISRDDDDSENDGANSDNSDDSYSSD